MLPWVALSPTMPVNAAGPRTEMATSEPKPIGDIPAAMLADSPPLDPPGVRSRFQGLLVRPVTRLSVSVQQENSGTLVLESGIAPALFMRVTEEASASASSRRGSQQQQ